MPPRAKISPEEKLKQFEEWKSSSTDFAAITKFMQESQSKSHTSAPDNAWTDISEDWQPFLTELYNLCEALKVPGRKAKCKSLHWEATHG